VRGLTGADVGGLGHIAQLREMSARRIVLLQAVNGVRKAFEVKPVGRLSIARPIWAAT
jgi:hypothetical protein